MFRSHLKLVQVNLALNLCLSSNVLMIDVSTTSWLLELQPQRGQEEPGHQQRPVLPAGQLVHLLLFGASGVDLRLLGAT